MKTRAFPWLLPVCMLLFACGPTVSRGPADAITFDAAKRLDDFDFAASGDGRPGKWLVHCHIPHHTANNNVEQKGGGGLMLVLDVQ